MGIKRMKIEDTRDTIQKIIDSSGFAEDQLKEAPKHQWERILKAIEKTFIKAQTVRINWYWEHLGSNVSYLKFINDDAHKYLGLFIPENEVVWFLVEKSNGANGKFWVYEGKINPIIKVLGELYHCEYLIVSKKLEWLLCENHHGYLIGTGNEILERIEKARNCLGADIIIKN